MGPNKLIPLSSIASFNGHNWPYIKGSQSSRLAAHIIPNVQLSKKTTLPKMTGISIATSDSDDLVILTKIDDKSSLEFYDLKDSSLNKRTSKSIEMRCETISNVLNFDS